MCGRFVVAERGSELVGVLRVDRIADELPAPSFNVAPTDRAAIVLDSDRTGQLTRRLEPARWGLVPPWAKDPRAGARAINARSEDADRRPTFRTALRSRRAVVPVTGYYEWAKNAGAKVPHHFHPNDGGPLFLAGLYEWWRDSTRHADDPERWLLSFTILTRGAVGVPAGVHDRMPVFLDPEHAELWLDPTPVNDRGLLEAIVDASTAVADVLADDRVSPAAGNVRNDSPELIRPIDSEPDSAGGRTPPASP